MTMTTPGGLDEVLDQDAVGQADLIRRGEVTAAEVVTAAISRIEAVDPGLNAVVIREFDRALDAARGPLPAGPFTGVPFLLKDLAAEWDGVRFTEGSAFLRDNVSSHDQELTRRIRSAGLVLAGKTNTPEFGALPTCEPALFGPTRNPWDPTLTPGGSSGGAAAAVAAGMVAMAYGNDAGGSIRFPASCCGVFGLKPTRARLPFGPEYGDVFTGLAVEFALTRSVRDAAVLLGALAGPDLGDPYWAPPVGGTFANEVGADPGRRRIAFCDHTPDGTPVHADCLAAVRDAASLCESLGHDVVERELPGVDDRPYALDAIDAGAIGWILAYWIRKVGREPGVDEIEPLTRAMWDMSRSVSAAGYLLAVQDAQALGRTIAAFFTEIDLWLTPTLAQPPVPIGHISGTIDDPGQVMQRFGEFIGFPAWVANATGVPAMSVPLYWNADGVPIGVHFLTRFGDEATLLRLAAQLEQAQPWAGRRPLL